SVAIAAGATESQFEDVVERLIASGDIKVWKAREIMAAMEAGTAPAPDAGAQPSPVRPTARPAADENTGTDAGYGKIILLGEHSVVYGHHAIAAPIPLSIRASVQRQPEGINLLIPRWGVEMAVGES